MRDTTLTPAQHFDQECAEILGDAALAAWEKVARLRQLALATIALPLCFLCDAEAAFCHAHAQAEGATCQGCGTPLPRLLCAACMAEETV